MKAQVSEVTSLVSQVTSLGNEVGGVVESSVAAGTRTEAGSYLRRIDFVYHSTLGFRVIQKKEEVPSRVLFLALWMYDPTNP